MTQLQPCSVCLAASRRELVWIRNSYSLEIQSRPALDCISLSALTFANSWQRTWPGCFDQVHCQLLAKIKAARDISLAHAAYFGC
jgi:hypothetical protein